MTSVAISGARSAIGRAVAAELERRDVTVVQLVRNASQPGDRTHALGGPISRNLLEGVDALVHLAWDWSATGAAAAATNLEGSAGLIRAAAAVGARPVLLSTFSAFAADLSEYGAAKAQLEAVVSAESGSSLRAGVIWGSGELAGILATISKLSTLPLVCAHISPDPTIFHSRIDSAAAALVDAALSESVGSSVALSASQEPVTLSAISHALNGGRRKIHLRLPGPALSRITVAIGRTRLPLPFRPDSLAAVLGEPGGPAALGDYRFLPGFGTAAQFIEWLRARPA